MSTKIEITELMSKIIPRDDYQHRNGFSNRHLIDKLSNSERSEVEAELIKILHEKNDMLVVETLGYMKSKKSLTTLYDLLRDLNDGMAKLITADAIFQINEDYNMIEEAKSAFMKLKDRYQIISAFYYLVKFSNSSTIELIKNYTIASDHLISYNAKKALEGLEHF